MNDQTTAGASEALARPTYRRIDHIAFAVRDLESAVDFFTGPLGFTLVRRRETRGARTGMISAELEHNGIKFVLCQGTEPESQVSQLIANNGPGVAHIGLEVDDPHAAMDALRARGMEFDTPVIEGPGLQQTFSSRCANSGIAFEFIHRTSEQEFLDSNVQQLFDELERSGKF
ncbi:MAG TPA: VOC family protein [Candidatus Elarobacter sp.]|nr:VOC family protein [Candidatus Elarobacter sp.]